MHFFPKKTANIENTIENLCFDEHNNTVNSDTLLPPDVAEPLRGRCFYTDLINSCIQFYCQPFPDRQDEWRQPGRLRDHSGIEITKPVTGIANHIVDTGEQYTAVDILISGVGIREMRADIAGRYRTKQGITQGMDQHVTIRMSIERFCVRYFHTAQDNTVARFKTMHIIAVADSENRLLLRHHRASLVSLIGIRLHIQLGEPKICWAGYFYIVLTTRHQPRPVARVLHCR